jgi:hypothetical protein
MPLASVVIAGLASSVAVAVLFVILARRYRRLRRETPEEPDRVAPQSPTDQE